MSSNQKYVFYSDEFKSLDDNTVQGYISTGDKDLVNDIVTPNCMVAMLKQLQDRVIKIDVEHESFRGGNETERELNKSLIPIAKITEASYDSKGIKVTTQLNPHHSRYQEVKNSIKDNFLDAFSIAYVIPPGGFKMKGETRMLENVNLMNVAFTGNPVNTHASFTNVALKSLKDGVECDESEINSKDIGGNKMTETEKKDEEGTITPETPKEETPKEVKGEEETSETPVVPKEEPAENVEAKAIADLTKTIDGLKSKLDEKVSKDDAVAELKAKVDEIDKVLSAPQFKARVNVISDAHKTLLEEKAAREKGPLDAIN